MLSILPQTNADFSSSTARIGQLEVEKNQLLERIAEMNDQQQNYERHFQQISAQLVRQVMSQKLLQDECTALKGQVETITQRCKQLEDIIISNGLQHLLQMSQEGFYSNMGQCHCPSCVQGITFHGTISDGHRFGQNPVSEAMSASTFSFTDADQQLPSTLPRRQNQPPNLHLQQLQQLQAMGMVETEFPADQPSPKVCS